MQKIKHLLIFASFKLVCFVCEGQSRKIHVIDDTFKAVDCKVSMKDLTGKTISVRNTDITGWVVLSNCSDTIEVTIAPRNSTLYYEYTKNCDRLTDEIKVTKKSYYSYLKIYANYYAKKDSFGLAALIFKELAFRESSFDVQSSLNSESNAIWFTAKAMGYHDKPLQLTQSGLEISASFESILLSRQETLNLKKRNGKVTYETIQGLTSKSIGDFIYLKPSPSTILTAKSYVPPINDFVPN